MNWTLIKEKYPKAEELADNWGDTHTIDWRQSDRWLYDFFDEQGIYINISREYLWEGEYDTNPRREWQGFIEYEPSSEATDFYNTRTEAEEQAFIKAFEILEDK